MPELPDVTVYVDALRERVAGQTLQGSRIAGISLLKTYDPPLTAAAGRTVTGVERRAKRIVLALDGDLYLVLHLMVAGRLRWGEPGAKIPARIGLAAFDFDTGTLLLTEAGTKKRASLHLVAGDAAVAALDRGGIEVHAAPAEEFAAALAAERHTLKRSLTDPRLFSGIGGAYADEILHRARLSPMAMSDRLTPEEVERLRAEAGGDFPTGVTAFRPEMAVHGKYGEPCPVCGSPVQRIVYASNETNYCPGCQTGGRILADRSLSRLLKDDFPRTLEDLE